MSNLKPNCALKDWVCKLWKLFILFSIHTNTCRACLSLEIVFSFMERRNAYVAINRTSFTQNICIIILKCLCLYVCTCRGIFMCMKYILPCFKYKAYTYVNVNYLLLMLYCNVDVFPFSSLFAGLCKIRKSIVSKRVWIIFFSFVSSIANIEWLECLF